MAISFTPGQTVAGPDWEALFQQHGGPKSHQIRPMTKAEENAALDAGDDPVQNPIYRYYASDGSYVEARKAPNGDYLIVDYKPSQQFQAAQKPVAATPTPDQKAEEDEKAWNAANGPGGPGLPGGKPADIGRGSGFRETHLERRAREAREAPKPGTANVPERKVEQGGDGKFYTVTVTPSASGGPPTVTVTDAQGNPAPGNVVPGKPEATKTPTTVNQTEPLKDAPGWRVGKRRVDDGKGNITEETYFINPQNQETTTPPTTADGKPKYTRTEFDKEKGVWWGLKPDGTWETMTGGPGARPPAPTGPGTSGPSLPQMVLGQSTAALRQYYDQLRAEVSSGRQTQAWADNRWNEAKDMAHFSLQEAQLMQQERQSSLNAQINLATTKLNHETGGIKTALEFALAINGKLPVGSPAGGQAFAALLGLNMLAAKRSGIYDIQVPNSDQRSLESRQVAAGASTTSATTQAELQRLTNPGDPKAVEAQRAEVQAQLETEVNPKPEPIFKPQPVAPEPAPAAAPVPTPTAPPAAPAPAPAAPAPAPPVAPPTPAPAPAPPPSPPQMPAVNPITGEPTGLPVVPGQNLPGEPGYNPTAPRGQMAPPVQPEQFAALNQYQPPPMPEGAPVPPPPVPEGPSVEPLALLRAQAAAKPVWRMTEDEYNRYVQAGVPMEDILRTPTTLGLTA
jgi:hypothetical protein